MQDENVVFCRILLRAVRQETAEKHIPIPKHMTAIKSYSGGSNWWLVECDGWRKEVNAHNAYEAKAKAIEAVIKEHEEKLAPLATAFEFGYRCCEKGMNLQAAMAEFYKVEAP